MSTTLCPDVKIVDEMIARNKVARAIARANMTAAVRDFVTRVYMLADDEDAHADGEASARVLAIGIRVLEQRGQIDDPDGRVMRGATEAIVGLSQRQWRWRIRDARAIDQGLQRALAAVRSASADEMQRAWRFVRQLELQAAARPQGHTIITT